MFSWGGAQPSKRFLPSKAYAQKNCCSCSPSLRSLTFHALYTAAAMVRPGTKQPTVYSFSALHPASSPPLNNTTIPTRTPYKTRYGRGKAKNIHEHTKHDTKPFSCIPTSWWACRTMRVRRHETFNHLRSTKPPFPLPNPFETCTLQFPLFLVPCQSGQCLRITSPLPTRSITLIIHRQTVPEVASRTTEHPLPPSPTFVAPTSRKIEYVTPSTAVQKEYDALLHISAWGPTAAKLNENTKFNIKREIKTF